jgi:MFS family permease
MRFAENMIAVAIGWQVFAIHKDPLDLGLIGLAEFVPLLVLALPAGHLADRLPRRVIAAFALALMVGVSAGLLAVTLAGASVVWPYFMLAAVTGAASAIGWPAYQALTPEVCRPTSFRAQWPSDRWPAQVAVTAGPAVGGLVFAWKAEAVYAVAAVLFSVAGISMAALHVRPARGEASVGLEGLVEGVRFVWRTRMLLGAITLDLFAVLVGGGVALLPIYAREILHVGPAGLGVLRAAPAIGRTRCRAYPARGGHSPCGRADADHGRRPLRRREHRLGASTWLPITLVALAIAGFVDMISVNIRSTTVALVTPNELRGRVARRDGVHLRLQRARRIRIRARSPR